MRSLRFLLAALLAALRQIFGIDEPRVRGHAFGPSGPWHHTHVKAHHSARRAHSHGKAHVEALLRTLARPTPARPPPHILHLLANAPEVEPELAPLVFRPSVLAPPAPGPAPHAPTLRSLSPPSAPPPDPGARAPRRPLALRLSRAVSAVAEWLVVDAPPDRGPRRTTS